MFSPCQRLYPTNERQKVCNGCYCHIQHTACQVACAAGGRAFIAEQRLRHGHICRLCTQMRWLGVARHIDGCQLQQEFRAIGYWLVLLTNVYTGRGEVRFEPRISLASFQWQQTVRFKYGTAPFSNTHQSRRYIYCIITIPVERLSISSDGGRCVILTQGCMRLFTHTHQQSHTLYTQSPISTRDPFASIGIYGAKRTRLSTVCARVCAKGVWRGGGGRAISQILVISTNWHCAWIVRLLREKLSVLHWVGCGWRGRDDLAAIVGV